MKEFKIIIYLRTLNGAKTLQYFASTAEEVLLIILKAKKRKIYDGFRLFRFDSFDSVYREVFYEI